MPLYFVDEPHLIILLWSSWCHSTTEGHIWLLTKWMLKFWKKNSRNIYLTQQYIYIVVFVGNAQRAHILSMIVKDFNMSVTKVGLMICTICVCTNRCGICTHLKSPHSCYHADTIISPVTICFRLNNTSQNHRY
jgi:hypothetical protein